MELDLKPIELPGIEKKRPMIIAGPCSAETEEQVMDTATMLANKGIKIFRAGIWKPRTNPWNILQPQVAKSRHRGAKPSRRCGLLGEISLLSPG